ncbi:MAG: AAA family ATPase [Selenomonadaceae bacterium]|nr:AAA family ATPase [Selenomonadaceae bacterium]
MADQATRLRNLLDGRTNRIESARVIAVTSGKGGVGKTNLALNLSIGLQKAGKKVLLIDADIGMANINLLMGRVTQRSIMDLVKYKTRVEDVIEESNFGIKYISGVAGVDKMLNASHEDLRIIQRKIVDASNMVDTIVIDTGAGLSRYVIEFILFAREILLVTTSEPASMADAYTIVKAYNEFQGIGRVKLVVNRVRSLDEWNATADQLNQTTQKFLNVFLDPLGYVYEDKEVATAVKKQEPFLIHNPNSPASRCVRELVKSILNGTRMPPVSKGWRGVLQGIFG